MFLYPLLLALSPLYAEEAEQTESPEKVQQQTGFLNVTSSVPAQVYVDHKVVGETPIKVSLAQGKHLVRIVANGFDPFVRRVRIMSNQTQALNGILNPGGGTVEFASPAPKATVKIDGKAPQVLPIRLTNLSPGEHSWTIQAPKHEERAGSLVFSPGQNLYLYEELDSSSGLAFFETSPKGASFFMDTMESSLGETPSNIDGLDLKEHTVVFQSKQYAMAFRSFDNREGTKGIIKTSLSKIGADVTITTNQPDATVSIEKIRMGTGKKIALGKVERGLYDLVVSTPAGLSSSTRVSVPSKGKIHLHASLYPEGSKKKSTIAVVPPIWEQWYFWAGIGGAVAASTASGVLIYNMNQPIPAPNGDVSVTLP